MYKQYNHRNATSSGIGKDQRRISFASEIKEHPYRHQPSGYFVDPANGYGREDAVHNIFREEGRPRRRSQVQQVIQLFRNKPLDHRHSTAAYAKDFFKEAAAAANREIELSDADKYYSETSIHVNKMMRPDMMDANNVFHEPRINYFSTVHERRSAPELEKGESSVLSQQYTNKEDNDASKTSSTAKEVVYQIKATVLPSIETTNRQENLEEYKSSQPSMSVTTTTTTLSNSDTSEQILPNESIICVSPLVDNSEEIKTTSQSDPLKQEESIDNNIIGLQPVIDDVLTDKPYTSNLLVSGIEEPEIPDVIVQPREVYVMEGSTTSILGSEEPKTEDKDVTLLASTTPATASNTNGTVVVSLKDLMPENEYPETSVDPKTTSDVQLVYEPINSNLILNTEVLSTAKEPIKESVVEDIISKD